MSNDRLTVSETRELLTESLSRAQDCAADLAREVSDRDATIARLTAELAAARMALRDAAKIVDDMRDVLRFLGISEDYNVSAVGREALGRWRAGDHATAVEASR